VRGRRRRNYGPSGPGRLRHNALLRDDPRPRALLFCELRLQLLRQRSLLGCGLLSSRLRLLGLRRRPVACAAKASAYARHDTKENDEHPNQGADVVKLHYLEAGGGVGGVSPAAGPSTDPPIAPRISVSA